MIPRGKQSIPRSRSGSAMLAALCLAMVFAISISSYLALCRASLAASTRSIALAHCSELAEAGVEQALYEYNNGTGFSTWNLSGTTATATMTMTSSGLVLTSTNPTPLNYGNGMTGQVAIRVTSYTTSPTVRAVATFTLPSYAGIATPTTTQPSTTVTYSPPSSPATASTSALFVNAVAATTTTVKFSSAGTLDSYNSNPSTDTYQTYAASTPGYSAVVLSQDTATSAATVRLGNAVLHGYAVGYDSYSPGSTNWLSYSASGKIIGPLTPSATYIDSSRLVTSPGPYQPVILEQLPTNYTNLPAASTTDGATLNKTCVLGSTGASAPAVYSAGLGIILTGGQIVTIQGPVVIITYGGITISGGAQIQLATPQASLQIFDEYGNISLGGGGIVNINAVPLPKKLAIMSTTDNWGDTATISTNSSYCGVIYLPYMAITVSARSPTIYGSIVGSKVAFTYSPTIHYDIALRSPMASYSSANPQQSGAAFDYLTPSAVFGSMASTVP